jgi:hypothetical protein
MKARQLLIDLLSDVRKLRCGGAIFALALAAGACGEGDERSDAKRETPPPAAQAGGTRSAAGGDRRQLPSSQAFPPAPAYEDPPESSLQGAEGTRRMLANKRRVDQIRRLPKTAEAGCVKAVFPRATPRVVWGPPAPRIVDVRRTGGRATVQFEFARLPQSPACRPHFLTFRVTTGKVNTASFGLSDEIFRVVRARGSASVPLPRPGRAPYSASLQAVTFDSKPSRLVEAVLK